jgi:predicted RNA-binding Zn-ribbon protein involved in translation (DUF1610 family)
MSVAGVLGLLPIVGAILVEVGRLHAQATSGWPIGIHTAFLATYSVSMLVLTVIGVRWCYYHLRWEVEFDPGTPMRGIDYRRYCTACNSSLAQSDHHCPTCGELIDSAKRCAACGYDLTANVSGRCPECGRAAPHSSR